MIIYYHASILLPKCIYIKKKLEQKYSSFPFKFIDISMNLIAFAYQPYVYKSPFVVLILVASLVQQQHPLLKQQFYQHHLLFLSLIHILFVF